MVTPNKDETQEDFIKRAIDSGMSADDAQKAWDNASDDNANYADVREGETKDVYVARFMKEPKAVATYPTEEGRKGAAEVKFAAHDGGTKFGEMLGVEILSTGIWSGSTRTKITSASLDAMVRAWNELNDKVTGFRPPLKLGHDDAQRFIGQNKGSGAPALGWVHNLRRVGEKIVADFKNVPSKLLDLIREKRYNSVSIELLPSLEFGGKTYSNVLTAVAILGAELPAVKGLQALSDIVGFKGAQDIVTLSEKEEDNMVTYTQEQHDALVAAAVGKAKIEFETAHNAVVTKLTSDVKVATEQAEQSTQALAAFKSDAEGREMTAFVDQAIKDGKVMPVEKDNLIAVGKSMSQGGKLKFGDKEISGFDAWKDMITKRPVAVNFKSVLNGNKDRQDGEPAGDIVAARANEKVAKAGGVTKLAFKDAVSAVLAEDPALKQRYFLEI